MKNKKQEKE